MDEGKSQYTKTNESNETAFVTANIQNNTDMQRENLFFTANASRNDIIDDTMTSVRNLDNSAMRNNNVSSSIGEVQFMDQPSNEMYSLSKESLGQSGNQTSIQLVTSGDLKNEVLIGSKSNEEEYKPSKTFDFSQENTGMMTSHWLTLLRLSMIKDRVSRQPSMSEFHLHQLLQDQEGTGFPLIS